MSYELTGKVHHLFPAKQITEKFKTREFVIESVDGMYTQFIKFQCNNDRIAMLDNLQTGAEVKVAFNLSGRAYTAKDGSQGYMTNLVAWKVDAGNGSQSQAPSYDSIPAPPEFPTTTTANLEHDEVPF